MMITINTITQANVKFTLYPDNQPHVNVSGIKAGDSVRVVCPIRSSLELVQLLEISNAIDGLFALKSELVVPYLMGARFDRRMQPGDSVDLESVASMINHCGFQRVHLFDVHSDVALRIIHRSGSHDNSRLVKSYNMPNAVLICPDQGAAKKMDDYVKWNPFLSEIVYCLKKRDLSNGNLTLQVLSPEKCEVRNCVIIDDICDGGATFIAIAKQIKADHLTLIVSHGIFSNGFGELDKHFDQIITSDSYQHQPNDGSKVTVIKLNL